MRLFSGFWQLGIMYNIQNANIQMTVHKVEVKCRRKPKDEANPGSLRTCNMQIIVEYQGVVHSVCRTIFLATTVISKQKVDTGLRKIDETSTPQTDQQGTH